MSVKVKRKLWIFAAFIPLRIRYNNKPVGTLYGSQEIEIPSKDEGELKYHQPIGRDDQLQVQRGDVVQLEETMLGKFLSTLLILYFIYLILSIFEVIDFTSYSNYEQLLCAERIALGGLLIVALISFFFKTHRLVLLNR
ncbi:MAG: hypothetical protein ACTH14_06785 [Jeotgalicoccus sp.]